MATQDYIDMIAAADKRLAKLRELREHKVQNLELFVQSEAEEIRMLDAVIAKAAEGRYHLESMRQGRPPPGAQAGAAAPASSAPASSAMPTSPQPTMVPDPPSMVVPGPISPNGPVHGAFQKAMDEFARQPIHPSMLPDPARAAPGFPVTAPDHARTVQAPGGFTEWESEGHPDFSPADPIDEKGIRTVLYTRTPHGFVRNGRIRKFDYLGRLLSDEAAPAPAAPAASSPVPPTNGAPH